MGGLAQCCSTLGKNDEALSLYNKALSTEPNNIELLNGLAMHYYNNRQIKEALAFADKVIKLDKENENANLLIRLAKTQ